MIINTRLLAATAILASISTISVEAVNRIYVNPFTVDSYEVKEIQVRIETSDPVNQAQCTVTLPSGLKVNGTPTINKSTFPGYTTKATVSSDGSVIAINCLNLNVMNTLKPGDAVMATIPVQAVPGALDMDAVEQLSITKIVLPVSGGQGNVAESTTSTTDVTFVKSTQDEYIILECSNAPVVVNPGDTREGIFNLSTNQPQKGMTIDIAVPEHIKLDNFRKNERLPESVNLVYRDNTATNGKVRVILLAMGEDIPAGNGPLMSFDIKADSEFTTTEKVDIVSIDNGAGFKESGTSFEVVSGQIALEQAMLALSEGEGSLANYITSAMNTISSECPLVADREEFNMMPYFNKVQDLMAAAEKGYDDYTLTPDFAAIVTVPAAQVRAEVDALVAAAREAQTAEEKRRADNKSAYDADMAAIADLREALEAAKEEVRKEYPDYVDEEAENDILDQINALAAAADAEYKSVTDEGTYDYKPDVEPVLNAISGLVPAAAERFRVAYNDNLYDEDIEKLADLQKMYEEGVAEVREKNPSFDGDAMVEADIEAARDAVEAEYARVKDAGFYEAPAFDYASIAAAIEAMVKEGLMTGIELNIADIDLAGAEIYTLDGRRHSAPVKGQVNVIRYQNSVIKVVVK